MKRRMRRKVLEGGKGKGEAGRKGEKGNKEMEGRHGEKGRG